jgi:hypothetical protein
MILGIVFQYIVIKTNEQITLFFAGHRVHEIRKLEQS